MTGSAEPTDEVEVKSQYRIALVATFLLMVLSAAIGIFSRDQIDHALFRHQDFWLMLVVILMTVATQYRTKSADRPRLELNRTHLLLLTLAVFLFCTAGHYSILSGFNLTRDEKLADFDAWILFVWNYVAVKWSMGAASKGSWQ